LLVIIILTTRYIQVQTSIKNQFLQKTEYSTSGFTPSGVYGHGNLVTKNGSYGWYVYDIPDPQFGVKKICAYDTKPQDHWDIDFVYVKGDWYKLRSGMGIISDNGFSSAPKTQKWKNLISTKISFPVRRPDFPYRLKVFVSKIKDGSLSPLEYLQSLKASNPNCVNMPEP